MSAIGAKLAADIPTISGKIQYDYYHDPVASEEIGLPYCNVLFIGETEEMTSNQLGGLTIVNGLFEVSLYVELTDMDGVTITDRAIGTDALADVRQSIKDLIYDHAAGTTVVPSVGFMDLQSISSTLATVRTLSQPYVVVTVKPEIRFQRAYDQR